MNIAGTTRSYNHRHKGRQSAFVVDNRHTGKPLASVVSNVSQLINENKFKQYTSRSFVHFGSLCTLEKNALDAQG